MLRPGEMSVLKRDNSGSCLCSASVISFYITLNEKLWLAGLWVAISLCKNHDLPGIAYTVIGLWQQSFLSFSEANTDENG